MYNIILSLLSQIYAETKRVKNVARTTFEPTPVTFSDIDLKGGRCPLLLVDAGSPHQFPELILKDCDSLERPKRERERERVNRIPFNDWIFRADDTSPIRFVEVGAKGVPFPEVGPPPK